MMKRLRTPSPAMVVALIALVLAAAGTATAALKGKDKQKVRSIADQEIVAKAPGLSVASAANAQSAQSAQSAASATSATTAGNAQNANLLGGVASGGFVRSFGGHVNDTDTSGVIFSVPEMQVSILPDSSPASSADYRIRNDASSGKAFVSQFTDPIGVLLQVNAASTSADQSPSGHDGPFLITSEAHPDLALVFGCAEGQGSNAYCIGQLMKTPAG